MDAPWWPSAGWIWILLMLMQMGVGGGVLILAHRAAPAGHGRVLLMGMVLTFFFSVSIAVSPSSGFRLLPTAWALGEWLVRACLDLLTACAMGPDGCEPGDGGGSAWTLLLPLPLQWALWCLLMTLLEWSTKPELPGVLPQGGRYKEGHVD